MGIGRLVSRLWSVGPTESISTAPGHAVSACTSLALWSEGGVRFAFSGGTSGSAISRVSKVFCAADCSCAAAAVAPSAATSVTTATIKNTLNNRMRSPVGLVVSLLCVPIGGASPSPSFRSALHCLPRVYEPPAELIVFSAGPEIGGGPLYPPADLRSRAVLGSEQTGHGDRKSTR